MGWGDAARSRGESVRPELWPDAAWYPTLGPTGNVLRDVGGRGRHGLATNIAAADLWSTENPFGRVLRFSGSAGADEVVETSYTRTLGDFTCVAWFLATGAGEAFSRVVDKRFDFGFWMGRNQSTANSWGAGIRETSGDGYGDFLTLGDGSWHQLVCRRRGTEKLVLGNGGSVMSVTTVTSALLSTDTLNIGNDTPWRTSALAGCVGPVLLFERAISDQAIVELFDDPMRPLRRGRRVYAKTVSSAGSLPVVAHHRRMMERV